MKFDYYNASITSWCIKENSYIFHTEPAGTIQVTAVTEDTFRVYADMDGTCCLPASYAVEDAGSCKGFPASLEELPGSYLIRTKKLALEISKENIRLVYHSGDLTEKLAETCAANAFGRKEDGSIYLNLRIGEKEHFYGTGEDNDAYHGNLDRRNTKRDLITGQRINTGKVTADFPVTFFMSTGETRPYGMFFDNTYHMSMDFGCADKNSFQMSAQGGELVFYFFAGKSLKEILNGFSALTGRPALPPLWTLGFTQCKCSYNCWDEIDEIIENFIENKIPLDCIVFDYDWAEYFNNYKWHSGWEGKSPEKIAYYREKYGIHFMVSSSGPMLKKDSDTFESALEAGILAKDENGDTITCGHYGGELMDFSNPDMKDWLRPQLNKILEDGVEAWWLDLTEPEGDKAGTVYAQGPSEKVHNIFSNLCNETYHGISQDFAPEKRSFVLTRCGTAGIQKNPTALWSGDVYSDYDTLKAHVPEALNTGMSGIPMWTCDSGGFISSTNNALCNYHLYNNDAAAHGLLYERWMQFSCFSPMTRAHHAGESAPYRFGRLGFDSMAHYIRLRYRLLPYIYSYYYKSSLTGEPIMRPLILEYPNDINVINLKDEYLFGSELLAAPVLDEGASSREVYLPAGNWIDMDYEYEYEGENTYLIPAPQNRIPVFIKKGSIIPMCGQIMNTRDLDFRHLRLAIYPDDSSSFTAYADDGRTTQYQNGQFTTTEIICKEQKGCITEIMVERSNSLYAALDYIMEIHVNAWPDKIMLDGVPVPSKKFKSLMEHSSDSCFFYDEFKRILYLRANISSDIMCLQASVTYRAGSTFAPRKETDCSEHAGSGQLPYLYPPASIPCRFPCVNYDRGGINFGFRRIAAAHSVLYREDNAGITPCEDAEGAFQVEGLSESEWLAYTLTVRESKYYPMVLRCKGNAEFSIGINSQNASGLVSAASESFTTITIPPVFISEGEQTLNIKIHKGSLTLHYLEVQ